MRWQLILICSALLASVNGVSAHATLVRGALVMLPDSPQANAPFRLRLGLLDPNEAPVQDAVVSAQFRARGESDVVEARFTETRDAGIYESSAIVLARPGNYQLLLRDQTYRQEEARAEVAFRVGGETPKESYIFVFPPTATGGQGVGTWLLYVVLLPVVAAAIVTFWVLSRPIQKAA